MRMKSVVLRKDGSSHEVSLLWDACVAAGYTGRDQAGVRAHVEELKKIGVPSPERVPSMYWIEPERIGAASSLWVVGNETSGEGEVFLARCTQGNLHVTVASDHTDRALETVSVSKAKQIATKLVGAIFWRVDDVRDHWDEIELRVWNDEKIYQEGTLGQMLPPEALLELAEEDSPVKGGRISLFSGTLPVIGGGLVYGSRYVLSLRDPVLNRELRREYAVQVLPDRN